MNKKNQKPWCPRCEQGWVSQIRINPLHIQGYLCEECSAFWFTEELIQLETFIDFGTFLETHGIKEYNDVYDFLDQEAR
jgi:hypothetical protein